VFGYVKPYPPNLLVREYEYYRAAYCGLCRTMQRHTGKCSALSLSYDVLLLALVRMLYLEQTDTPVKKRRCLVHPLKKRPMLEENPALVYAAKASALLSYYKLKDDITDKKGFRRFLAKTALPLFTHSRKKAKLADLDAVMQSHLTELRALEEANCASVDEVAAVFGTLLGEVFCFGLSGDGALVTRALGQSIGKYIYVADAIEDYPKDVAENAYNPFRCLYGDGGINEDQKENIHTALLVQLCEAEAAMNLLPRENRDAVIHIIENTVCEGLPRRIRFLKEPSKNQKGKENSQPL